MIRTDADSLARHLSEDLGLQSEDLVFLFSGVFFPLEERLSRGWLVVAEVLPLVHPVRLARGIFQGDVGILALWDAGYALCLSTALLFWARRLIRRRLMA